MFQNIIKCIKNLNNIPPTIFKVLKTFHHVRWWLIEKAKENNVIQLTEAE